MVEDASPSRDDENGRSHMDQLRSILTKLHLIGVARFIDRSVRRVAYSSISVLRSLARLPLVGRGLDPLLTRIDRSGRLSFELGELLRVSRAMSDQNLDYWVAGGWGLDALIGSQTRRHGDLDVVVDRFHENLPRVGELLTGLGYRRKKPLGGTVWFPDAEVYEDGAGHHIEVLNINWAALARAWAAPKEPPHLPTSPAGATSERTPQLLEKCTSRGTLESVSLPVLSLAAQQLFHVGYAGREEDSHAHEIMRLVSEGNSPSSGAASQGAQQPGVNRTRNPTTLLLVPIFTFPPDLTRLCRLHRNDLDLIPPHVTLAFPFLPLAMITDEVVHQLTALFNETPPFDFELGRVKWFATEVVYLEPTKSDAFRSITEAIQDAFPEFHPYEGAFESVIPHVTLSEHGSLAERRVLGRHAPQYLPISSRASRTWLMSNERVPDRWSIVKIFDLGSSTQSLPG